MPTEALRMCIEIVDKGDITILCYTDSVNYFDNHYFGTIIPIEKNEVKTPW